MVRVWVPLMVVVSQDDLWALGTNDRDEALQDLIERSIDECVRLAVVVAPRHSRIAVSKHHHVVVSDDAGGLAELGSPDSGQVVACRSRLGFRVQDLSRLPSRCGDENRSRSKIVVPGNRRGALARLVIWMGMKGNDRSRHPRSQPHAETQ